MTEWNVKQLNHSKHTHYDIPNPHSPPPIGRQSKGNKTEYTKKRKLKPIDCPKDYIQFALFSTFYFFTF